MHFQPLMILCLFRFLNKMNMKNRTLNKESPSILTFGDGRVFITENKIA